MNDICRRIETDSLDAYGDAAECADLLEELACMLESARTDREALLAPIELATRHMAGAAPDELAQAALDFRDRFGFPRLLRL